MASVIGTCTVQPPAKRMCTRDSVVPRQTTYAQVTSQSTVGLEPPDHLKDLYAHDRDNDCYLEEKTHTYFVKGSKYPISVSGVMKVFWEHFDSEGMSKRCLICNEGIKSLQSSCYNLVSFLTIARKIPLGCESFWDAIKNALEHKRVWYADHPQFSPPSHESVIAIIENMVEANEIAKPDGSTCYFLCKCLGCTPKDLQEYWDISANIESFKGTFLHKQAELFIQAMGLWQKQCQRTRVPIGQILADAGAVKKAIEASAPRATLMHLVAHTDEWLWDHPIVQDFFAYQLETKTSPEFLKFLSWLDANPALSPYRTEWSIYEEDHQIAGQIDSLWFDTSDDNRIVMADWKRCQKLLSADLSIQQRQVYGKQRGRATCARSSFPGPCAKFFDCQYNHYLIQQNLYASFLKTKYDVMVKQLLLVQCHPKVGTTSQSYHEAEIKTDERLTTSILQAFHAGWGPDLAVGDH